MKAEINNETKAKFFAQYWAQEIQRHQSSHLTFEINKNFLLGFPDAYIELNPLSSISDEDAIEVAKILGFPEKYQLKNGKAFISELLKGDGMLFNYHPFNTLLSFDFLRSCGYALPFMGLSVDEMVEAGWIKLTSL